MKDSGAANRYIKSLLSLAVERGVLEDVHQDMLLFSNTCKENRNFELMLLSPVIRHDDKKKILRKIFSEKVNPLSLALFDIMTSKNREAILPAIAKKFHFAYNEYKGISRAYLTTPFTVDAEFRKEIENMVKKLSHKDSVELIEKKNSDLIGGFILQVGDKQIDTSIKSKLKILDLKFKEDFFVNKN